MKNIAIVKTEPEHLFHIARYMRDSDRHELAISTGRTPLSALVVGYERSDKCYTVLVDDEPTIMFGYKGVTIISPVASIWMLGTDKIKDISYRFIKSSRPILDDFFRNKSKFFNYVWEGNTASIQWLKWLGFDIHDPKPYGIMGENFHYFEKRSDHV